jgi:hypothetical protein
MIEEEVTTGQLEEPTRDSRILIVEDHRMLVEALARCLRNRRTSEAERCRRTYSM